METSRVACPSRRRRHVVAEGKRLPGAGMAALRLAMPPTSGYRSYYCRKLFRGLSLIEVVAALVLLAGCAVALLTAQGRSLDQLRAVRTQETAAGLARELTASWKLDPTLEQPSEGYFESAPGWRWERQVRWYSTGSHGNLQEIMLKIYRPQSNAEEEAVASYTWIEREIDEDKTTGDI